MPLRENGVVSGLSGALFDEQSLRLTAGTIICNSHQGYQQVLQLEMEPDQQRAVQACAGSIRLAGYLKGPRRGLVAFLENAQRSRSDHQLLAGSLSNIVRAR